MKLTPIIIVFIAALSLGSCQEKSLQKYLVQKQDDPKFITLDVPASLLKGKNNSFTQEQLEILETVKKVNVVAYPIKEDNMLEYEKEKEQLQSVLDQPKYKELTRIKSNDVSATLKYTGDEDAIDEVIIFASDNSRGFAIFRLLGENMRPDQMLLLMKAAEKDELNLSQFNGLFKDFKD